ncbi:hypothetical protein MJ1_0176 [Nanobdella aerobiophila]|uniref:VapB-type antitoxin n=1 Tax=Nanobdella aerobiophila TaxID=2586965 RepID=A0A915SZM7_9ARCH|nr:antitoxin VapB family protein [Nanobdella aerobiophila]BBL45349.1 hypothetical protein MJ1_0176 [Nanobdella aerobiophila]
MITTITISKEIKEEVEKVKGNKKWDEFLMELINIYKEYKKEKIKNLLNEVKKDINNEELDKIEQEILQLRRNNNFRDYKI